MHKNIQKQEVLTEDKHYFLSAEYDDDTGYSTKVKVKTNSNGTKQIAFWSFGVSEQSATANWYWYAVVLSSIQRFQKLPDFILAHKCIAHKDEAQRDLSGLEGIQELLKKHLLPADNGNFRVLFDEDFEAINKHTTDIVGMVTEAIPEATEEQLKAVSDKVGKRLLQIY